jgi:hypothetical protein
MKQFIHLLLLTVFVLSFSSCNNSDDEIKLDDTGMVIDYAGSGNCGFVIELDNGTRILPLYYPDGFTFAQGQRVHVEYVELSTTVSSCDRGVPAEVVFIEELNCASYVDLYFSNYDSLARDPVFLHEAFVDEDCLQIKISYSGGCKEHTIDLARMHPWIPGSSTVPVFEIRHNANDDMCEAYFTREFRFDLSPLKAEGIKEFVLTAKLTDGTVYNKIFDLN